MKSSLSGSIFFEKWETVNKFRVETNVFYLENLFDMRVDSAFFAGKRAEKFVKRQNHLMNVLEKILQ